jgi:hypothetical protein
LSSHQDAHKLTRHEEQFPCYICIALRPTVHHTEACEAQKSHYWPRQQWLVSLASACRLAPTYRSVSRRAAMAAPDALPSLYRSLKRGQTRVLRLHSAQHLDAPIVADLSPAILADGSAVSLGMEYDPITYEAISYTWGQWSSADLIPIACNGIQVSITPSLASALRHFRLPDRERILWADALCINQNDVEERSAQVASMFSIFHKATRVLVWLGDATPGTADAMAYLQRVADSRTTQGSAKLTAKALVQLAVAHHLGTGSGLYDLYLRPWARRVWIRQEVFAAAQDLHMHCGRHQVPFEIYKTFGLTWMKAIEESGTDPMYSSVMGRSALMEPTLRALESLSSADETELADLAKARRVMVDRSEDWMDHLTGLMRAGNTQLNPERRMEEVLKQCRYLEATDPRDLIYALLPLTSCPLIAGEWQGEEEQLAIPVDYSRSVPQVFCDATRFLLNRDRSLRALAIHRPSRLTKIDSGLPSWAIDWRQSPINPARLSLFRLAEQEQLVWQKHSLGIVLSLWGIELAIVRHHQMMAEGNSSQKSDAMLSSDSHLTVRKNQQGRDALSWHSSTTRVSNAYKDNDMNALSTLEHETLQPDDRLLFVRGWSHGLVYLRPIEGDEGHFSLIALGKDLAFDVSRLLSHRRIKSQMDTIDLGMAWRSLEKPVDSLMAFLDSPHARMFYVK